MSPPPSFPYAPRRNRPLSLWNPFDYLLLLYWVFFFPQALRWYVETFSSLPVDTNGRQAVRQDAVQRRLALQGGSIAIVVPFILAVLLRWFGVPTDFSNVAYSVAYSVAGGVAFGVVSLRLETWFLTQIIAVLPSLPRLAIALQRSSPLPISGLRWQLVHRLAEDWLQGLHDCEGLLRYSLQFIPVITAIQQVLGERTPSSLLLPRLAAWCSMPLHDWRVVFFQSARLQDRLWREFWDGLFIIPRRWRPQGTVALRYDTPVRAACAGFWHLHDLAPRQATIAFAAVRCLPYGEELYANAQALTAAMDCQSLADIAAWKPPEQVDGELLRPQVHALLTQLSQVAQDVALVQQSQSVRQRNSALNRASGRLNDLPAHMHDCPTPERALLEQIARQWLNIVLASASAVGTLEVRQPVVSPYIVGARVPAERLAGRDDIFAQIGAMWAKPGQRDSLVIFGHRRTGKSSIIWNLPHFCAFGDDTGLAVLNLQSVDYSQGLSDLCYAIAFELWHALSTPLQEPLPDTYQPQPLAALRRLLADLNRLEQRCRYLLLLDEYELLDDRLPATTAEDFVTTLRGFTQQYPWLAVALVGLHTLQERSASYYQPIYTWRPLKVGLMDAGAVADMLQVEDDSFPLEYSLEAVARVHDLTGGQPFLVQLLGDSLVQHFNRHLRQQLEPPSPVFAAQDVDAVVEDENFYQQGDAYFRGIWAQAGETPGGQHTLLQTLAPHAEGLAQSTLQQASGLDSATFAAALDALSDHDVVTCRDGICLYYVELMRRWVAVGVFKKDQ